MLRLQLLQVPCSRKWPNDTAASSSSPSSANALNGGSYAQVVQNGSKEVTTAAIASANGKIADAEHYNGVHGHPDEDGSDDSDADGEEEGDEDEWHTVTSKKTRRRRGASSASRPDGEAGEAGSSIAESQSSRSSVAGNVHHANRAAGTSSSSSKSKKKKKKSNKIISQNGTSASKTTLLDPHPDEGQVLLDVKRSFTSFKTGREWHCNNRGHTRRDLS